MILLAVGMAGCGLVEPEPPGLPAVLSGERREPSQAWARLPDAAGPVKAVLETSAAGGRRQRIVLEGAESLPGENAISVSMGPAIPPTEAAIVEEMRVALPGTPMRFAPAADRNAVGGFAYAVGEAGPFTCVYAWQSARPAAEIRVRLCRTAPAADTVALVRALALALPEPAAG